MAGPEHILYTDGACRGNPGEGGAGAVLMDGEGNVLAARMQYIGPSTNNIAEYKALLLGLTEALGQGVRELQIRMDSELVVRQITGVYKIRQPHLQPLMADVRSLLRRFDRWSVCHVPREENRIADRLANEAIDGGAGPYGTPTDSE